MPWKIEFFEKKVTTTYQLFNTSFQSCIRFERDATLSSCSGTLRSGNAKLPLLTANKKSVPRALHRLNVNHTSERKSHALHKANETNCTKRATAGPAFAHVSAITGHATGLLDEVDMPLGSEFVFGENIGFVVGADKWEQKLRNLVRRSSIAQILWNSPAVEFSLSSVKISKYPQFGRKILWNKAQQIHGTYRKWFGAAENFDLADFSRYASSS